MLRKNNSQINIDPAIAKDLKIAIVRSEYHGDLTQTLEKYCILTLKKYGALEENIKTYLAPGALEIPIIAQSVAKTKTYDAIIAFGVIVKGETYHFELIATTCTKALMQISLDYSLPIAQEILTVYDINQAQARAGENENNKGIEGALAVLKVIKTLKSLK